MKYIIRLNKDGFFGRRPYTTMKVEDAKVFNSMKEARKQLNRLRTVLHYPTAEIEVKHI
jgi:hypothetical protein